MQIKEYTHYSHRDVRHNKPEKERVIVKDQKREKEREI